MSQSQTTTPQYGIKEFDLSTDRAGEENYELVQAPNSSQMTVVSVPDECYLHFGTKQSPGLDVRDYGGFKRENGEPFGQFYLSNPTGSTGTLRLLLGVDLTSDLEETIGSVESIRDVVSVQEDSPLDVSGATVTVNESAPVDVSAATVPVQEATPLDVSGATVSVQEAAALDVSGAALDVSAATVPTEQQTPVGVEDSAGGQIDPSQQADYATAYTSVDLNAAATTTVYDPATDAEVTGVHVANSGGGTAEMRLEVTDGTNTAVLSDPAAGDPIHFSGELRLDSADSLQIVGETAEGSALTETAAVSRGEI